MTTRAQVVETARSWLDVPYRHQHRDRIVGVDCAGMPIVVARELGIVAPDFDVNGYPRDPDGEALLELCDRFMRRLASPQDARPGDVIVLCINRPRWPDHLGFVGDYMTDGLSLIHALGTTDGKGQVVEHELSPKWLRRAAAAYALPGVTD